MFTDDEVFAIGVDTHRDTHAYAVVDRATGQVIDQFQFPPIPAGTARRYAARVVLVAGGCGRSRGPVATAPGSPTICKRSVSGWWRSITPTGATAIPAGKAMSSTRSALPA